jgi:hypothetical protein
MMEAAATTILEAVTMVQDGRPRVVLGVKMIVVLAIGEAVTVIVSGVIPSAGVLGWKPPRRH